MKQEYEILELEIIELEAEDIITTSDPNSGNDPLIWDKP